MNKNLKLFTSDLDRLAFEDSNSYERPYISAVSGDAHFNKLITGTIENPDVDEVNVQNGDYFDRISILKNLTIGNNTSNIKCNILCFPFDITVNELREALGVHKLSYIFFASDLEVKLSVLDTGKISYENFDLNFKVHRSNYDNDTIIYAGTPFVIAVDFNKLNQERISFLFTFKNKIISFGNSLVAQPVQPSNWYIVGSPFKNYGDKTGLCTASQIIVINSGDWTRSVDLTVKAATCSGWLEYRGPVPSVTE